MEGLNKSLGGAADNLHLHRKRLDVGQLFDYQHSRSRQGVTRITQSLSTPASRES